MVSAAEEEVLDTLLEVDVPQQFPYKGRWSKLSAAVVVATACFGVVLWGSSNSPTREVRVDSLHVLEKAKASATNRVVHPHTAMQREEKRPKLVIEKDLAPLVGRSAVVGKVSQDTCLEKAETLFDDVVRRSGLDREMQKIELKAFRQRFVDAMTVACKRIDTMTALHETVSGEIDRQKPLVTSAFIDSVNEAGLGFGAHMHDWLVHESAESFTGRLGLLPTPKNQKSIIQHNVRSASADVPEQFRAETKWPQCTDAILRIHNQGHCGSCWAFGGMASLDARMCVSTNGTWESDKDILSRMHALSCAPDFYWEGHDGCQGGFPHWPMEMMARTGIVSKGCVPYYISGEGVEHFDHQDVAPPCETHCQGGYSIEMSQDTYKSTGAGAYSWLTSVHGDAEKIAITKAAIYQDGPVAFAFYANRPFMAYRSGVFSVCTGHDRANHAVYMFGWGLEANPDGGDPVEFMEASNSWGTNWGADGHFKIHPRCVTDVTIPGPVESDVIDHEVGTVNLTVPRDPENDYWPWAPLDECPFEDGCVTDMQGNESYIDSEVCVSKQLNNKKLRVEEFDLEYRYDTLTINGRAYSGSLQQVANYMNDLEVDENGIMFKSDGSISGKGFKLCAK